MKILMILGTGAILTFPTIDPAFEDVKPDCFSQGHAILQKLATYQGPGPEQGWILNDSNVYVAGWYCQ
jgi:hypothetical protein